MRQSCVMVNPFYFSPPHAGNKRECGRAVSAGLTSGSVQRVHLGRGSYCSICIRPGEAAPGRGVMFKCSILGPGALEERRWLHFVDGAVAAGAAPHVQHDGGGPRETKQEQLGCTEA